MACSWDVVTMMLWMIVARRCISCFLESIILFFDISVTVLLIILCRLQRCTANRKMLLNHQMVDKMKMTPSINPLVTHITPYNTHMLTFITI